MNNWIGAATFLYSYQDKTVFWLQLIPYELLYHFICPLSVKSWHKWPVVALNFNTIKLFL